MPLSVLGKVKLGRWASFKCLCVFFYIAVTVVISLYQMQFKGIYNQRWIQIRVGLQRNRDIGHHATGQSVHPPVNVFLCGTLARERGLVYGLKESVQRCLERVLPGSRQFQEKASMLWSLARR